jgi:hypothetical protein
MDQYNYFSKFNKTKLLNLSAHLEFNLEKIKEMVSKLDKLWVILEA